MANHSEVICSDDGDSGEPEMETSRDSKRTQGNATNSALISDDGDSGEMDMGSFIRIRSEGDGIFEDEDDDEFEEIYNSPEADLGSPPSRKRKQEINFREHDIIEISDEPEFHEENVSMDHHDIFQIRRRDRTPLYLLNPDDYAHDTKKQIQIRRAIITYRHHQEKKAQIIMLTEESGRLREHVEALKGKVLELANCGCPKNKKANLDILNVEIPIVPPRMYIRGNRPVLAVPYNKGLVSAEMIMNSSEIKQASPPKQQSVRANPDSQLPQGKDSDLPRPFVNIASTRLQNITSSTLGSVNIAGNVPRTFTSVTINGTRTLVSQAGTRPSNLMPRPLVSGTGTTGGANPNFQVKVEPGINSDQSNPATSASRIVFAKQPGGQQTASQLLFASKFNPAPMLIHANGVPVSQHLTIRPTVPVTSTSKPVPQLLAASSMGTLLRTASGQVLRVVQSPNPQSTVVPGPSKVQPAQPQKYAHILPKPDPSKNVYVPPSNSSQVTKEALKHMWSRIDDEDEDELAIIAAISGRSPSQILADSKTNNRKQVIGRRESFQDESSPISGNILRTNGADIELNKYADIVFEEAD